jgi:hypothetical protein
MADCRCRRVSPRRGKGQERTSHTRKEATLPAAERMEMSSLPKYRLIKKIRHSDVPEALLQLIDGTCETSAVQVSAALSL